jgi:hypothetical protein
VFEVGDEVVTVMEKAGFPQWEGLIGRVEKRHAWGGYQIRFPFLVPEQPHADPYILNLSRSRLRLYKRRITWEV